MSGHPHVLIFDSGVGGLSVAREVLAAYPQCRLTYASDNAAFPYGSKAPGWLIARVESVMAALIEAAQPDVIVIACNTASTVTLPHLRNRFATPFIGVVPAIKPAAHMSSTKTLGVLATPATVSRAYTQQLIADYAAGCKVLLHGSSELVIQAERLLTGEVIDQDAIARELHCLINRPEAEQLDTIVLACTHFPLLRKELERAARPRHFQWVDSGEAIARRVGFWIGQLPPCNRHYDGAHQVMLTASMPCWPALRANLPSYLGVDLPPSLALLEV